jgi:subtilase family serine protease
VPPLAVGSSNAGSSTVTLPSPLEPGQYFLFAKADGPAAIQETSEFNNFRSDLLQVGPDLVVSALTAPSTAGPGQAILVSDTTKNQGGSGAGGSSTRFYLSDNFQLDAGDAALQARSVPALAPGVSSSGTTSVTIPTDTATGQYYLIAKADAGESVGEYAETNNTRAALIRIGGDLTVAALSVPSRAAAGGTISVSDTTRNAGAAAVEASSTAFYLSANFMWDPSDTLLTPARSVPPLAPSASSFGTTTVTLPDVPAGTWYLIARADSAEAVDETNETNNTRIAVVQVGPDLLVSLGVVSFNQTAGATINLTDTVRNQGAGDAGPSTTRLYLSSNYLFDPSDLPLGSRAVPAIAGGASQSGTTSIVIPAGTAPGTYYLIAVADADGNVAESSEANNVGWRTINVK